MTALSGIKYAFTVWVKIEFTRTNAGAGATVLRHDSFCSKQAKIQNLLLTMWKAQIGKAIKEVRFVLKQSKEHQGAWYAKTSKEDSLCIVVHYYLYYRRFIETRFHELRILNQTTFWHGAEINHNFKTPSAIHFIYGDGKLVRHLPVTDKRV